MMKYDSQKYWDEVLTVDTKTDLHFCPQLDRIEVRLQRVEMLLRFLKDVVEQEVPDESL